AADRMRRQLVNDARRRRANLDAIEQVAGGNTALDQFGLLALGVAELLDDIDAEILIDANDLKLRFADLRLGLGDRGQQLPAFTVEPGRFALQRGQSRQRHQALVIKVLHAGELPLDQLQLFGPRIDLHLQAGDFLIELGNAALQQILLALARAGAGLE